MALAEARLETSTGLPRRKSSGVRSGSLTEKSDVCAVNGCFNYGATQPHAVSSIAGTVGGVTNPNYFYDGNGNLRCMTALAQCDAGAAKTVAWTSFNMVSSVQQGTTNVSLLYDESHARLQQTAPEGVTQYLNDPANGVMTERFAPTGGGLYWRSYIQADGHIVAERSVKGSAVTVRYFTTDHLGSTIALTDEAGHLVESDAYDAWGKARDATTGADDPTCSKPGQSFTTRGFSGHEEMADLCLVNMNARIYDPAIGRFLSPDDVIPDAFNGQSYNRYSYVDNNPLSYTDPTGHLPNTNSSAMADMSAPVTVTVYIDSSGEAHAMTGDANLNNMINHALGEASSHGGLSGAHLALAFTSSGTIAGAVVFHGGNANTGPADVRAALAKYFDQHNTPGEGNSFSDSEIKAGGTSQNLDKPDDNVWPNQLLKAPSKYTSYDSATHTLTFSGGVYDVDTGQAESFVDAVNSQNGGWNGIFISSSGEAEHFRTRMFVTEDVSNAVVQLVSCGASCGPDSGGDAERGGMIVHLPTVVSAKTDRHEFGHIFGLGHQRSSSVMEWHGGVGVVEPSDISRVGRYYLDSQLKYQNSAGH